MINNNLPPSESPSPVEGPAPQPVVESIPVHLVVSRPVITYVLIGVTVVIFILQMLTEFLIGVDLPSYIGIKYNPLIEAGQLWRLITPVFLHGSLAHIGFNMYALYALGPALEEQYGHKNFIMLYFIAAMSGNIFSFILTPGASLGASTAIFGLIAAQLIYVYLNRDFFGKRARSMLINIGTIIVINLAFGLTPGSSIDNWGHLGGMFGGVAFAWFAGPILKAERKIDGIYIANHRSQSSVWITFLLEFLILLFLAVAVIWIRIRG
jgi:rhomboid protease GluP